MNVFRIFELVLCPLKYHLSKLRHIHFNVFRIFELVLCPHKYPDLPLIPI